MSHTTKAGSNHAADRLEHTEAAHYLAERSVFTHYGAELEVAGLEAAGLVLTREILDLATQAASAGVSLSVVLWSIPWEPEDLRSLRETQLMAARLAAPWWQRWWWSVHLWRDRRRP